MSMGPVVELSGEIVDVEDLTSASSVMQSSESSLSADDEEDGAGLEIGAAGEKTTGAAKQKKQKNKRIYAMAIALVTLFAGCGYLAGEHQWGADDAQTKLGPTAALSISTTPSAVAGDSNSNAGEKAITPDLATSELSTLTAAAAATDAESDSPALLRSGTSFQIQAAGSDLCLDSDASKENLAFQKCDSKRASQAFVYDPFNFFLLNKANSGLCLDSGDGGSSGLVSPSHARVTGRRLQLKPCGFSRARHQMFQFDAEKAAFKSTHLGLCINAAATIAKDADSGAPASLRTGDQELQAAVLSQCDSAQRQSLQLEPIADTSVWDVSHPVLQSDDQPFLLRSVGKANLCLGSTSSSSPSPEPGTAQLVSCSPNDPTQLFTYNVRMHRLQRASDAALCLDDNGSWLAVGAEADERAVRMAKCDEQSANQHFVYDEFAMAVRSPTKPHLCLDDGGSEATGFQLAQCDLSSGSQQFQIVLRSSLFSISPSAILSSYESFVVESIYKGLCVDSVGVSSRSSSSESEGLRLAQCDSMAPQSEQSFQFVKDLQLLKSSKRPGYCWGSGGSSGDAQTSAAMSPTNFDSSLALRLERCDPQRAGQQFVFDTATAVFQSAAYWGLCVDDGGGWFAGETALSLLPCEQSSVHQKFYIRAA